MRGRYVRALALAAALMAFVAVAATDASGKATPAPGYKLATVGAFGGEPTITANSKGELYDTTPSGGTLLYKSTNHGSTWTQATTADPSSGDDCVFTDQSNAVYECNLAGSQSTGPLQADIWKSLDDGKTWMYGDNAANIVLGSNVCGTSCSPFGVDRQWGAAYIPPGGTTNTALVVLAYHDFYGPSQIWANISRNGGSTFGDPIDVMANFTSNSADQAAVALADSACNTVPIGADIARSGPHPGRIYVAWIASDPESAATGCNVTMVQSFHNLFVAWSDDGGATWTPQLAYDAGVGHDTSTPFASFTLDNQGNPYVAFTTPAPSDNPATCAAESTAGTVQTDPSCSYHMWVAWSSDGGPTWDGGGGTIPGSAAAAYEVDGANVAQTDVFPALAAGDPGKVDVAWLGTNEIEPTDPLGKFDPGGCAGPGPGNGNPTFYPPACTWNLYTGQSLNLTQPPGKATWTTSAATTTPMHIGDICNLGIFCVDPNSNRNLLDFISETVDPTTGYAHVAYADDNTVNKLRVANQVSGPGIGR
ncbi:MAG TPA: sialidase family protein [Gaiellaceae bacterium]|nr:sialidase family protein [Gaiellaceae bacterium]